MLDALRVVAPTLKIRYSTDVDQVISSNRSAKCTEDFSEIMIALEIHGVILFLYMNQTHGWIWVDSSLTECF